MCATEVCYCTEDGIAHAVLQFLNLDYLIDAACGRSPLYGTQPC